jgi:hypothetical protein
VAIGVGEAVACAAGFSVPEEELAAGQNHHAMLRMVTSVAAAAGPMMIRTRRDGRAGNPGTG